MVFFRAGGLALLEEVRDSIVLKLVRQLQGEVFKRMKNRDWVKRRDQRELIRVCQRQFRMFIDLRDWGEIDFMNIHYVNFILKNLHDLNLNILCKRKSSLVQGM